MDEFKLRQDAERALKAKQLLEDELLIDALEYARQSYTAAWKAATTPELREKAWDLVHAVDKFEEHLIIVLNTGKLADRQIHDLVAADKRRRVA